MGDYNLRCKNVEHMIHGCIGVEESCKIARGGSVRNANERRPKADYIPEGGVWTAKERQYTRENGYLGEEFGAEDEGARAEATVAALVRALEECYAKLGPADFSVMDEESGRVEYDSIGALLAAVSGVPSKALTGQKKP